LSAPPDILVSLVREAQAEMEARRSSIPLAEIERKARPGGRPFGEMLKQPALSVIAEMKARTPALGVLATDGYSSARLAGEYSRAGAAALSVLCQEASFGGRPEHLIEARSQSDLPILRKDFVVDEYQLVEARALDADAVLLIVAALPRPRLEELLTEALRWGLGALVEVHDESELEEALAAGATVIGINHRDLRTFKLDLSLTERLRPRIPPDRVVVAESGIQSSEDARRVRAAGADAVLVGEALMRAADVAAKIRELRVE